MGFYENLDRAIWRELHVRTPRLESKLRINRERWFIHLEKLLNETIVDSDFWLNFWLSCEWLKTPTKADIAELSHFNKDNDAVIHMSVALTTSLKAIVMEDYEDTETAEFLYEYWKLLEAECKRRGIGVDLDPYALELKRKKKGVVINPKKSKAEYRKTGSNCIFCGSDKISSNGNMWTCLTCNRNFRKS